MMAKCLDIGLVMRRADGTVTHPPVTLQPLTISRSVLAQLKEKQLLWNRAVDTAARDPHFLVDTLQSTADSDEGFTGRMLDMYKRIYLVEKPVVQQVMLGIFRTDYMEEQSTDANSKLSHSAAASWKNVEINTISVSFSGLSPLVSRFHSFIQAYTRSHYAQAIKDSSTSLKLEYSASDSEVPSALGLAMSVWEGSLKSWIPVLDVYRRAVSPEGMLPLIPAVLVVTQEGERNVGDQFKLLLNLLENEGRASIRRTLTELHRSMKLVYVQDLAAAVQSNLSDVDSLGICSSLLNALRQPTSSLPNVPPFAIIDNQYIASVVYFRSCYTPLDFFSEECWEMREQLERSNAIKCPSLPHYLMTWKKVQQRFSSSSPNVLESIAFRGNKAEAEALREHFVDQFTLNGGLDDKEAGDGSKTEERIQEAILYPERYVLKPQLEGGGNLYSGESMKKLLQHATFEEDPKMFYKIRREFILMRRIIFGLHSTRYFRDCKLSLPTEMSSELGLFGIILSNGDASLSEKEHSGWASYRNSCAGYVVRTKPKDQDDGGVMAGIACLDSLAIVD